MECKAPKFIFQTQKPEKDTRKFNEIICRLLFRLNVYIHLRERQANSSCIKSFFDVFRYVKESWPVICILRPDPNGEVNNRIPLAKWPRLPCSASPTARESAERIAINEVVCSPSIPATERMSKTFRPILTKLVRKPATLWSMFLAAVNSPALRTNQLMSQKPTIRMKIPAITLKPI